jgi:hypothetical protein
LTCVRHEMTTVEVTCPKCNATDRYGEELIGRYSYCSRCHCRFYVEVPSLEAAVQNGAISRSRPSSRAAEGQTTLDDVLWDTQQGSRVVIRSLAHQERRLQQVCYGVVALAILSLVNVVLTAVR